ncbi:MAG: chemotaxis protein CheW [Gemmatimonadaceae bacterium]|nr:chemotaxis protein CheW [Gemmatimonadaceae bacterium]
MTTSNDATPPGDAGRDAAEHPARVLILRAGDALAALPWAAAREVAKRPSLARLPGAAPVVSGVTHVRGDFVPLVELGALLGHAVPIPTQGWIVVVEHAAQAVAIGVDVLPELRDVEATVTVPGDWITQGVRVEGRELPLIDAARLITDVLH